MISSCSALIVHKIKLSSILLIEFAYQSLANSMQRNKFLEELIP